MSMLANVLVGLIGVLHVYVLVVEMFLWTTPYGMRVFGNTKEKAEISAVLAKNQGLYNGFLSAGLFTGLLLGGVEAWHFKLFFVGCVLVAGIYGAASTGNKRILFSQAVPATLTLGALFAAGA